MARPRSFDPEVALNALKQVFWEKGFEGTSMQDIEAATGLNKQSLYRLYGHKRGMYVQALAAYAEDEMTRAAGMLSQDGTARERVSRLFKGAIKGSDRRGCFLCNASVDQAQCDPVTRAKVQEMMAASVQSFDGALAAHTDLAKDNDRRAQLAAHLFAAYNGLRVMIAAALPDDQIHAAADTALTLVPEG